MGAAAAVWLLLFLSLGAFAARPHAPPAVSSFSPHVLVVDPNVLQEQLLGDQFVWPVLLYNPRDPNAKTLEAMFAEAAAKTKGYLPSGVVDASSDFGKHFMAQAGVQEAPAVIGFPSALQQDPSQPARISISQYTGPLKAASLVSWAVGLMPSQFVAQIATERQLEKFLNPAPNSFVPNTAKVLLFTNKGKTSPVYKGLSLLYFYRLSLGEVRASDAPALVARYQITAFPTLLVLDPESQEPVRYTGESFTWEPLAKFLEGHALGLEALSAFRAQAKEAMKRKQKEDELKKLEEESFRFRPPVNPTARIHTPDLWRDQVIDKGGITLVAWLDPAAPRHLEYLKALKKVWARVRKGGTKVHFTWVDGTQQVALATHFGTTATDMPAVTFLHPKKGWWKFMIGAFEEEKIWRYIQRELLKGGARPLDMETIPPFAEEANPDGLQELSEETPPPSVAPTPSTESAADPDAASEGVGSGAQDKDSDSGAGSKISAQKHKKAPGPKAPRLSPEEVEARNREREEAKAAKRRAIEELRLKEKADREAKREAQQRKKARKGRPGAAPGAAPSQRPQDDDEL